VNQLCPEFVISAHTLSQLPQDGKPEFAFAGRSNVGKSSLLNTLFQRKGLVKVSATPGKTQGLNYFLVDGRCYFVDLPGYGYAKVSKGLKGEWDKLISLYLEKRSQIRCVVIVIDLRHAAKPLDQELIQWLKLRNVPFLLVYTKADKLSGNQRVKNAAILDAGHGVSKNDRIIFSSMTKLGRDELLERLFAQA